MVLLSETEGLRLDSRVTTLINHESHAVELAIVAASWRILKDVSGNGLP